MDIIVTSAGTLDLKNLGKHVGIAGLDLVLLQQRVSTMHKVIPDQQSLKQLPEQGQAEDMFSILSPAILNLEEDYVQCVEVCLCMNREGNERGKEGRKDRMIQIISFIDNEHVISNRCIVLVGIYI